LRGTIIASGKKTTGGISLQTPIQGVAKLDKSGRVCQISGHLVSLTSLGEFKAPSQKTFTRKDADNVDLL